MTSPPPLRLPKHPDCPRPPADGVPTVTRETIPGIPDLPFVVRQGFQLAVKLREGALVVRLPDGRWFRFQGSEPGAEAVMVIRDLGFARRLASGGDIGIAEAYIAGEWDSPDVTVFLEVFCRNYEALETLLPNRPLMRFVQWLGHKLNRNTKRQAEKNIHAHYDLGNRFYGAWLDRTMTYSAGIYAPGDNDLSSAQTRKYRELARAIGLAPHHHVLEIGCGWGGFAEFAAREIGCKVTGLTISREQFDFATERMRLGGLGDRVEIKYQDYRDEVGTYDRIASIEMFEAVGEEYWPTYFGKLNQTLKPGGAAGLQVITIQDRHFPQYRREIDFIRRYIFPGGMLPTPTIMRDLGAKVGLSLSAEHIFGLDYARTLAEWRDRFWTAWPNLTALGFDERFRRLWEYYLHYCEAGFRAGSIDVRQMVFAKA